MLAKFLFFFLAFLPLTATAQIQGVVFSAKDSIPLQGVSIYFDGTSIGTVTDSQGKFMLDRTAATIPLIISYLGFETVVIQDAQKSQNLGSFYLEESSEQLAEVFIETDTWSREKKLQVFLREFFGPTPEALQCRIKNPEVLELKYSPSTEVLSANSREPLQIINRHLGYEITYWLESFKAQYGRGDNGFTMVQSVSYQGTSFFKNLRKKPGKRHIKNRISSYRGSSLQFMRSLAQRELEENGFEIYFEKFKAPPYQHFKIIQEGQLTTVELIPDKVSILFGGILQSGLQVISPFHIDRLGNHSPPLAVLFSGDISIHRIAHLLPLDYQP